MLDVYEFNRPKPSCNVALLEPSDALRSFVFSSNLAAQDITGDIATSCSAATVLAALQGSYAQYSRIFGVFSVENNAVQDKHKDSILNLPSTTDDSPSDVAGFPLAYVETEVYLAADTNVLAANIVLDAELQPLEDEDLDEEAQQALTRCFDLLSETALEMRRPIIHVQLPYGKVATSAHNFCVNLLTQHGYRLAHEEIHGYVVIPLALERVENIHTDCFENSEFPDEIIPGILELLNQSNTDIPTGDLLRQPQPWTLQRLQQSATANKKRGNRTLTTVLRDDSGCVLALSEALQRCHSSADLAEQGITIVDCDHRNQGYGTRVKAAALKNIHNNWPKVKRVFSDYSSHNTRMGSINSRLGFQRVSATQIWQLTL